MIRTAQVVKPRLGFLGVGWIGRNRMLAVTRGGHAQVAAIADPAPDASARAADEVGGCTTCGSLDDLLSTDIDGLVIATPSALHADQAIAALDAGIPVFCQKPLGRTAGEVKSVVEAARRNDLLLGVDMSYRYARAFAEAADLVRRGDLGRVWSVDLAFHNSYGPDKAWFLEPVLSGGGCVIDLGIHLVDLVLWTLGFPQVLDVRSRLFRRGRPLDHPNLTEDHAIAEVYLEGDVVVRLSCSWFLSCGRDAVIEASFFGTDAAAEVSNVGGSFYDFRARLHEARTHRSIAEPPDDWSGRCLAEWAQRLARGEGFDPEAERYVDVARVVDAIYGRGQ